MNELWMPIKGYEELYEISNHGKVRSFDKYVKCGKGIKLMRSRELKWCYHNAGYPSVGLYKNGVCSMALIHRLVAEHFIPNPDSLPEVNHKDLNKSNPLVDNLEWVTHHENMTHAGQHGCMNPTADMLSRRVATLKRRNLEKARKVKCIETGQVYKNSKEVCGIFAISPSWFNQCIAANHQCKGQTYIYI